MTQSPLEASLPLTPLQEGMFFHALYDDEGVDVYAIQVSIGLDGPLAVDALQAAAGEVLARHSALRAGFQVRRSGEPVQLIRRDAEVPWTELDLRGLTPAEQDERLARYRAADRVRGFDLARPPLLRLALARIAEHRHVLIMTYHHILLDAWSFQLVLRDLFTLYEQRQSAALPAVVPFRRYLGWLAGQDREAAGQAWAAALAGLDGPTLVAAGAQGPSALPRLVVTELSEEKSAALSAAARRAGLTLNTVVQAMWALLVSGVTGRTDVVFGQTVSGRPPHLDGVEEIVGLLINAVPVRVRLDPAEPLAGLLDRIQREQADLAPYHHFGLAEIQRLTGVEELFDTSIAFGNAPREQAGDRGGLRVVPLEEAGETTGSTHYPLSLMAVPGDRLCLGLSYRADLFGAAAVERLATRLTVLLDTWLAAPGTLTGRTELLSPAEWTRVVREWNDTGRQVPDATLPDLFAAQTAGSPDAVAVVCGPESLTYAQFAQRVEHLAAVLRSSGTAPGDFVAVAVPRSVELLVALHAVVAVGAAYVPIDPEYPADRIEGIVKDAQPALLLTTAPVSADLPLTPVPRLLLDEPLPPALEDGTAVRPTGQSPAYVIFTSGSTGRPKGVVVPHAAIVNRLRWMQEQYPIGPGDRVLQKTPAGFDVSVWEFFWALQTGAAVVLAEPGGHKDPAYLAALIRRESVTTVHFVPSMLQVFLPEPAVAECTSLRQVFASGEALSPETQDQFFARLPQARLHNLYGPTEAAVDVTYWPCRPGTASVPIGRPVWNTQVFVLDTALRPLAPGTPGELYLAGRQLAHGYAHSPGLTAERFVASPFHDSGERMYRTGDVVRWSADGDLEYLGRADDQVKIRGQRVELGEIEVVLARHPDVAQVAVVVREDQPGAQRLVAYVVPAGSAVDAQELLAHAADVLPEYMVPAALVQLADLPLTANGKLDRKALPAPGLAAGTGRRPRGAVEELLAGLFADLFGRPEVGADDSFHALGGDSIISIQLVARARQAGLLFTPKDVLTHRTVAALARVARRAQAAPAEDRSAGLGDVPALPIVHWFGELAGRGDGFNQSVLLRVPAGLGLAAITGAVQAVLDRHDALRMRRTRHDGQSWALDIAPPGAVRAWDCVRRVDVTGLDTVALRAAVAAEAERARGDLAPDERQQVRVVWFDAGPDAAGRLLVMVHHLAVDGVSWRILVPDLRAAWESTSDGTAPRLAAVPTSLRTWARRLTVAALDPAREAELPLWTAMSGEPEPALAHRALDPVRDTFGTARTVTLRLPADQTEPLLTSVPAAFHAGVEDVLLTALALAVGSWRHRRGNGGGTGVLVDLEGHGREDLGGDLDLSRTVGWFTTLYPVRLDPGEAGGDAADPWLGRALKRVKEQVRALPDRGIGYGLLRHLNPATRPALGGLPTPQIGFNYLGRLPGRVDGDWQPAAESDATGPAADAGLALPHVLECGAVTEDLPTGPELVVSLTWPGGLLAENEVRELAEAWTAALRLLAAHAALPGTGGLTVSDIRPAVLRQCELERLEAEYAEHGLADVLPLTPLQQGLLFHARYDRGAPDVYHVQLVLELAGPLRVSRLHAACQALADRHSALRAAFVPTASGVPVQLILRTVTVPWQEYDLRGPAGLADFLAGDRLRRSDPERAPLLRFSLLRLAEDRHALVFTLHHLLADGWSTGTLLRDLGKLYESEATELPTAVALRPYLGWLAGQDVTAAETAWRAALAGLTGPTLLAPGADVGGLPTLPEIIVAELPADLTAALTTRARTAGLTLNTVVQGAWALLLATVTGQRDVVFGATVSVRPPELPSAEDMVGLLINTVPVRVRLEPEDTLGTLLTRLQAQQTELLPHTHLGPMAVQRLAGVGPLYDTAMVFENYPLDDVTAQPATGLRITGFSGRDAYHYPLRLLAAPGDRLHLQIGYRPELIPADQAADLVRRLRTLIEAYAADPHVLVGDLLGESLPVQVARLAADALGVTQLEPDSDFFDHGGDSLRALRLVQRLGESFGETPDVRVVFQHRTPARIAAAVTSKNGGR